jgi:GT2 family glycosyltransferase
MDAGRLRATAARPPLTVGITTRNRPAALLRCLRSLSCIGGLVDRVIVADDGSDVAVEHQIRGRLSDEWRARTDVIRLQGAGGYIVGRNRMVERAATDSVLLLDDDTALLDEVGIRQALGVLEARPSIGAVAFAQAEADGRPWPESMQPAPVHYPCYVPAFIGFAHLLRRDVFLRLGGYRTIFHFYGEEKEYSLRLLDAGHEIVYLPDARVAHLADPAGRSASRYLRYVVRNDCLGALYNDPWYRLAWMLPARLALYFRMRSLWRVDDPGGFPWILRELRNHWTEVWRQRRPVGRVTLRRRRRLRRDWPRFDAAAQSAHQ